jgi:hypothetical protein
VREGKSAHRNGDRTQSTVWDVPNANPHGGSGQAEQTGHGTQKPVEIMRRPILNHTNKRATLDGVGATFEHVRDGRQLEACDAIAEEALAAAEHT